MESNGIGILSSRIESYGILWNLIESYRILSNLIESYGILSNVIESLSIDEKHIIHPKNLPRSLEVTFRKSEECMKRYW